MNGAQAGSPWQVCADASVHAEPAPLAPSVTRQSVQASFGVSGLAQTSVPLVHAVWHGSCGSSQAQSCRW